MKLVVKFAVAVLNFSILCSANRLSAECPLNWGSDLQKCDLNLCDFNQPTSCPVNISGQRGLCCSTRCGGRNCFYPPTVQQHKNNNLTCPLNWILDLISCDLNTCNVSDSSACRRRLDREVGLCCKTACGGQNCYYQSDNRNIRQSVLSIGSACPSDGQWMGIYPKRCSEELCTDDKECASDGVGGRCCNTSCGGKSCVYSSKIPNLCPIPWNGHSNITCVVELCLNDAKCNRNGMLGHCCATTCGGRNCFYPQPRPEWLCPHNWTGIDPSTCGNQLCTFQKGCVRNGQLGWCCRTACGGQNCYYITTEVSASLKPLPTTIQPFRYTFKQLDYNLLVLKPPSRPALVPSLNDQCPNRNLWPGNRGHCTRVSCVMGTSCNRIDLAGICCPTRCGGANCFIAALFLYKPLSPDRCPTRWIGLIGNCGHKMCNHNNHCVRNGKIGYCCRTVCGGKNCLY